MSVRRRPRITSYNVCYTKLLRVAHQPVTETVLDDTARRIAGLRATAEAKEGLSAFLDKRPAAWAAKA